MNSGKRPDLKPPTNRLACAVREQVSAALGNPTSPVLLHRPFFPAQAWAYVKECLDSGWVSSAGSYVTRFEEMLAKATGCRRAIAMVNGTTALEVSLLLAGVNKGDEVLCPSLSFVATANAISHCGAKPHFVDVCNERLSVSTAALSARLEEVAAITPDGAINRQTGNRIAALCVMHCFGHPADLDGLLSVCKKYSITLVEDAAESLGSFYRGLHTGRTGLVSAVSFNGNKILTTGGGGAILTDDDDLADRARHLTSTAKLPHPYEFRHDEVAWNYRLPNLNAALGVAQLEVLDDIVHAKRSLAEHYRNYLRSIEGVEVLSEPADCFSNYWLNTIVLPESPDCSARDQVLDQLNLFGLQSRPIWVPMHMLPMYASCARGPMGNSESLYRRVVNIPSSPELSPTWVEC
jgi:perosamine synthetase